MTLQNLSSLRVAVTAALVLASQGAAAADMPPLAVRTALDQPVAVHGLLNLDHAGNGANAVLYPVGGAGLVGLLAAVATHAVIANSAQNAEKKRLRDEADLMLVPHRPALEGYRMGDLVNEALPMMSAAPVRRVIPAMGAVNAGEAVVESVPLFFVTQDGRALVLQNVVTLRANANSEPLQKTVRVVTKPGAVDGALDSWFSQRATRLRETGAQMMARSLDLAINDLRAAPTTPGAFSTVRYPEGGTQRMERAQILSSTCENQVLRTLRGDLLVVPRQYDDEAPDPSCVAPAPSSPPAPAAAVAAVPRTG